MLQSGLVSISFRPLAVLEVCRLARRAGLTGIEWGGDVHVPPGDAAVAREARALTTEHGLTVAAYGSYYRAGMGMDFAPVLESALELGAPSIRIWPGEASADCDAARRGAIIEDLIAVTRQAAGQGVTVATEYHSGTLTDNAESAEQMLRQTAGSGLRTLWQPMADNGADSVEKNLAALRAIRPSLLNVHVYCWTNHEGGVSRHALREGRDEWARYFEAIADLDAWAMLEFVRDDEPENLIDDARTLNALLRGA